MARGHPQLAQAATRPGDRDYRLSWIASDARAGSAGEFTFPCAGGDQMVLHHAREYSDRHQPGRIYRTGGMPWPRT